MMSVPRFGALRSLWLGPALLIWAITVMGAQAPNPNPQSASPTAAAPQQRSAPPTMAGAPKTESIPVAGMPSVISNGDLLNVSVFGVPDYAQEARVDASGQVTLPFIGTVKLAGMSINDAETLVAKQLAERGSLSESPGRDRGERVREPGRHGSGRGAEAGTLSHRGQTNAFRHYFRGGRNIRESGKHRVHHAS